MLIQDRHRDLVASLPLNRLLTETDGSFTPVDGRQSRPLDVAEVLPARATLRGTTPGLLRTALLDNLRTLVSP